MAVYVLEEVVELKRMLYIQVVDNGKSVPFHIVFIEQSYATHYLVPCRPARSSLAIGVVKLLRSVNRYAYKEVVVVEEFAPFVGEHSGIGLYAVVDASASGILLLQSQCLLVERYGTHQCLAAVPCEHHFGHGLRFDIVLYELIEQLVAHYMLLVVVV